MSNRSMPSATHQPRAEARGKFRLTYLIFIGACLMLIVSSIYGAYSAHQLHDAQLPQQNLEQLVRDMRQYHQQTGRFPRDFRELDERLWQRKRSERISDDGSSLSSPSNNYHYTLHTVAVDRACVWAVPTGARASEAATHFWTITPERIERWTGPALTLAQVSVVRDVPSEGQLALLAMTKQTNSESGSQTSARNVFTFLGF